MSTSILKTHYRRGANVLTSEQIKEIRCLKNKVPAYMIVKEYHLNKNRVHDIWNDCEHFQQNGNHFFEELRKVQSISSVPALENNLQEKENNHPISGTLDQFHESIEMDVQKMQKMKKKLP
ncbi:18297_t:CDS:1, partial [Gigaspora margarita]